MREILIRGRNKRQKEIVKPALFEAARTGSLECIQKVFEIGDDICPRVSVHYLGEMTRHCSWLACLSLQNESGESPFAVAAKYGNVEVIKWLESVRLCLFGTYLSAQHVQHHTHTHTHTHTLTQYNFSLVRMVPDFVLNWMAILRTSSTIVYTMLLQVVT